MDESIHPIIIDIIEAENGRCEHELQRLLSVSNNLLEKIPYQGRQRAYGLYKPDPGQLALCMQSCNVSTLYGQRAQAQLVGVDVS